MPTEFNPPIVHATLTHTVKSRPSLVKGRGKSKNKIVHERLEQQQGILTNNLQVIVDTRNELTKFGGNYVLLCVKMFDDSIAPVHTPDNLFSRGSGCELVAPLKNGYLVEANIETLPKLIEIINKPPSYIAQYDISRVKSIHVFNHHHVLRGQTINHLWKIAHPGKFGRLFSIWLAPYRNVAARIDLTNKLKAIIANTQNFKTPEYPMHTQITNLSNSVVDWNFNKVLNAYVESRTVGQGTIEICSKNAISNLISSGTIFRIEPISPITASTNANTTTSLEI